MNKAKVFRNAIIVILSWYFMMVFHETGHIVSVLINGGKIEKVILWPWTISQTIRSGSHHEIIDIWAGPILGIAIPGILCIIFKLISKSFFYYSLFLFGFCLISNGIYFGIGWIDNIGDTGELIELGFPVWPMIVFGVISTISGFIIWHYLGLKAKKTSELADRPTQSTVNFNSGDSS